MTMTATRTPASVATDLKEDLRVQRTRRAKNIATALDLMSKGAQDSIKCDDTDALARLMHQRDAYDYALRDWTGDDEQELRDRFDSLCRDLAGHASGSKLIPGSYRPKAYWEAMGDIFNDMSRAIHTIAEIERKARG